MQAATHSPSLIAVTPKDDRPALELGAAQPGVASTEVSSSQVQLPLETLSTQPMSLSNSEVLMPGAVPFEPREDAADLLESHPTRSDDESEPARLEAQGQIPASSSQSPQRQEMADGEFRSVYSLRFGSGSAECQACAECSAGCGVCFLGLSVGVWACHCPHAVPFAITGGSMAGVTLLHGLAKDWGCIPEIHSEMVYQPGRSA